QVAPKFVCRFHQPVWKFTIRHRRGSGQKFQKAKLFGFCLKGPYANGYPRAFVGPPTPPRLATNRQDERFRTVGGFVGTPCLESLFRVPNNRTANPVNDLFSYPLLLSLPNRY